MKKYKMRISNWLSKSENRAIVHAIILILGAGVILCVVIHFSSDKIPKAVDKASHFIAGQAIASAVFFFTYLAIISRILLIRKHKKSLTIRLLWIPTILGIGLLVAVAIVFIIAAGKEFFDMGGTGNAEMLDLTATVDGAMTIIPIIAVVMALTPIFIPLDLIMQLPKMMFTDIRTGITPIDDYVNANKKTKIKGQHADVLLLEDDISCATLVLTFCSRIQLSCHHVSSLSEAETYFVNNYKTLNLLILDNFVRVEDGDKFKTGYELLKAISKKFPPQDRSFSVVMISGHTDLIKDESNLADLILQKPWRLNDLLQFLKSKKIVNNLKKENINDSR